MQIAIVRRLFALLIALFTLYGANHGMSKGDVYTPDTFPIIEAEPQAKGTVRVMSFNIRCEDVNGTEMKYRIPLIPAQVNEIRPDSFGVQECTEGAWRIMLRRLLPDPGKMLLQLLLRHRQRSTRSSESNHQ